MSKHIDSPSANTSTDGKQTPEDFSGPSHRDPDKESKSVKGNLLSKLDAPISSNQPQNTGDSQSAPSDLEEKEGKKEKPIMPLPVEVAIHAKKPIRSSIEEAKAYVESFYQPVADGIVEIQKNSRVHIFSALDPIFWPTLPMGYKWFREDPNPKVLPIPKKHIENEERKFEITIFGPNEQKNPKKRVNYVTWFGNMNVQTYANTRPANDTYQGSRSYPITTLDYSTSDTQYVRSHCIDHVDSITQDRHLLSTSHSKNFIPEPFFWNDPLRRTWVGRIRANGPASLTAKESHGAYMQRVYYHDYSLYDCSPQLEITQNKTAIPMGTYFAEIDWERKKILKAGDISWSYDFSKLPRGKAYLNSAMPVFSIESEQMPAALTYPTYASCEVIDGIIAKHEDNLSWDSPAEDKIYSVPKYNRHVFEQYYQAAETEYSTVLYKFSFILYCASAGLYKQAEIYFKRAADHAKRLKELDIDCRISQSDFNLFVQYHKEGRKGFTDERLDFWKACIM